jgi:hypothetical protein
MGLSAREGNGFDSGPVPCANHRNAVSRDTALVLEIFMVDVALKRDVAISMRFRIDDLGIIDRGAFEHFVKAISTPVKALPAKLKRRLERKAPWATR